MNPQEIRSKIPVVFVEPDETKSSSRFPVMDNVRLVLCPGLEERTGSDFIITSLLSYSLKSKSFDDKALKWHLANNSLFVQRKSGYDALSFDNLKRSVARAQKCKIPPWQNVLLFIGDYVETKKGGLAVVGNKPFGKTTYKTFLKLKAKWRLRGGFIDWIEKHSQLEDWIEVQAEALQDVKGEGIRELFPHSAKPFEKKEHILQNVIEIPPDDWRHLYDAGMKGVGIDTLNSVKEYVGKAYCGGKDPAGIIVWIATTMINKKGKQAYKIPGWGPIKFNLARTLMGLGEHENISISDIRHIGISPESFEDKGWDRCLDNIDNLRKEGFSGAAILRMLRNGIFYIKEEK